MPGAPGRSGGARLGAGRPAKGGKTHREALNVPAGLDPLEFLRAVQDDESADPRLRVHAAVVAAQYVHAKKGEGGKKDERQQAAKEAGKGKFAPSKPPRLAVVNGGKSAT